VSIIIALMIISLTCKVVLQCRAVEACVAGVDSDAVVGAICVCDVEALWTDYKGADDDGDQ